MALASAATFGSSGPMAKALLEYETLTGDEIKTLLAGGSIDRGSASGPASRTPASGWT